LKYKNSFRTSQETYYITVRETNRLMLFGEKFAVYCENRTEHTNILCGQNVESFSMLKHVVLIVTNGFRGLNIFKLHDKLIFSAV
jgi:hypothetical protein